MSNIIYGSIIYCRGDLDLRFLTSNINIHLLPSLERDKMICSTQKIHVPSDFALIQLESSLIESEGALIQLESSLIQLKSSPIQLESYLFDLQSSLIQ